MADRRAALPSGLTDRAAESVGAAFATAGQLPADPGAAMRAAPESGFYDGLQAERLVASGVALLGAVVTAIALPARPAVDTLAEPYAKT